MLVLGSPFLWVASDWAGISSTGTEEKGGEGAGGAEPLPYSLKRDLISSARKYLSSAEDLFCAIWIWPWY